MSLWLLRSATRLLRVAACGLVAALPALSFGADTAIQLASLAGHSGPVSKISYSPDGRWLLSSSWDGTARLWDAKSGREVKQFSGFKKEMLASAFSPDGLKVLTAGYDYAAHVWDLKSGHELLRLRGHTAPIQAVYFSKSGRLIATGAGHIPPDAIEDPTVRIWSALDGSEVSVLAGHTSSIRAVAILPGDEFAVSAGADGTVRRWDVNGRRQVAIAKLGACSLSALEPSPDSKWIAVAMELGCGTAVAILDAKTLDVRSKFGDGAGMALALSPSGDTLAVSSGDGTLGVWKVADGSRSLRLPRPDFQFPWRTVAFSPDGRVVTAGANTGVVSSFSTADLAVVQSFGGRAAQVMAASTSRDGRWMATVLDGRRAGLWDIALGRQVKTFSPPSGHVSAVALSPDGSLIAVGAGNLESRMNGASVSGSIHVWSTVSGKPVTTLKGHFDVAPQLTFMPGGRQLLSASYDGTARLWNLQTGEEVRRFSSEGEHFLAVAASPNGQTVAVGTTSASAIVWDAASGRQLAVLRGPSFATNSTNGRVLLRMAAVNFSLDGARLLTGSDDGLVREWDVATATLLRQRGFGSQVVALALMPDGQSFVAGCISGEVHIADFAHPFESRLLIGHSGPVLSVAMADSRIITASTDRTVRVWDSRTGADLAKLFSFQGDGWAVVDSNGNFDEPNAGSGSDLYWVAGLQTIDLSQFKQRFYLPGLLTRRFSAAAPQPKESAVPRLVALGPDTELARRDSSDAPARIYLLDQGGGIGRIRVRVNGKLVVEDGVASVEGGKSSFVVTQGALAKWLAPGEVSDVEVQAYNRDNTILGSSVRFGLSSLVANKPSAGPKLWVISIGVSQYVGSDGAFDLQYAANDAKDMSQVLQMGGSALFGKSSVDVRLLASEGPPETRPTKANIKAAFARLKDANASDVVVVYFSGHGLSYKDEYYFPTEEVNSLDVSDPVVRASRAISGEEIAQWMITKAKKQAIVFDTCSAGAIGKRLSREKGASPEIVRGLERVRDRAGLFVLMGSAADKESYEASPYERGLLTHALLDGMRGASVLRDGRLVSVAPLFDFAKEQVQDLAPEVGGVQIPFVFAPRDKTESFYIGSLDSTLRSRVPYHSKKPLLLRANLINQVSASDDLKLSVLLTDALRRGAFADGVGKAAYVFYDVGEMNGGIAPSGLYQVTGGILNMDLRLNGRGQPESLKVACPSKDIKACVAEAAAAIKARVRKTAAVK